MSERNIDRKIRFFSFAVAATLFAFVSAATGDEKELEPNYMPLKVLILDHAEADANEAISHGDLRFLAVQGYSLEIPGVTGDVSKIERHTELRFSLARVM